MIRNELYRKTSLRALEHSNYSDYKRVMEYYDKWDAAARNKDFHNAEHYDYMIRKIHERNGLEET